MWPGIRPATATLLWHHPDVKTREFLIDRARDGRPDRSDTVIDPAELARRAEIEHRQLRRRVAYADGAGCLRTTILRYFRRPAPPIAIAR